VGENFGVAAVWKETLNTKGAYLEVLSFKEN
jgi:hypothetical protein